MTDYKIENTDINDEENFRAWERLVMDYEPVRRNLYEVYCKSLKNGCKKATKPEPIVESDCDNFSSDEEDIEEINSIDTTEELTQQLVDKNLQVSKAVQSYRVNNLNLQFFQLEIPKMDVVIKLFHKNSANKHVSFTTDSSEFSQNIVIQKDKDFWNNIIENHSNFNATFQFNKKQKEIFLAAYPYDKKRLPPMFITYIKD